MFLSDKSGAIHLEVTSTGAGWTAVGPAVTYDKIYEPSYSLGFAEAAGTYVVQGWVAGVGKSWSVVRPADGVQVPIDGPAQVATDGGCASTLVSGAELHVVNATSGALTKIALPATVSQDAWVSTWIPGDDALLNMP